MTIAYKNSANIHDFALFSKGCIKSRLMSNHQSYIWLERSGSDLYNEVIIRIGWK